ncbi:hypothetical protein BCR42DRAFT_399330 [Absidia repens]|uniref:Uncharacterized protein n=1 Tax=Absidia repens TaxID=90262 RepID=A0A1X2IZT7_9FUNG|nr:hypothetical protein BCR42DRAFT_399330 [Absidia repens]
MNPSDFPPLNSQGNNSKQGTSLESSWAEVAKEPPHCSPPPDQPVTSPLKPSYADTAGHEAHLLETSPTPAEQSTGRLSNEDASEFIPPNPSRSYADVSSHAGFPSLDESIERETPPENDLSDLPPVSEMLEQPSVEEDVPSLEEKEATESSKPLSIYDEDKFPSLEPSTQDLNASTGTNNTSSSLSSQISEPTGQSYVQVASQDLDQAPPPAQARVDSQPLFDENHMMTESARRETRRMKQMENSGQVDEMTPEMAATLPQQQANVDQDVPQEERQKQQQTQDRGITDTVTRPNERQYKDKFTIFNTIATLHDNGYSWLTSLATAVLLHLRYSPFTSPYRFPFIYRSITDIATLPIYTKPLQPTLSCLPILQQQSRQQLDQSISDHGCSQNDVTGLRLQDGFRVLKKVEKDNRLRWWQVGLWASHRMQWTVSYMALQDASAHLVTSSTLLSLKSTDDQV